MTIKERKLAAYFLDKYADECGNHGCNDLEHTGDEHMSKAILVCGLAWGDEGKGSATDFLCRKHNAKLVVRYNGGSQAEHNVVLPDGTHHTFSQYGSGSLIPGVKTYLSSYMLVNPIAMEHERELLSKLPHGVDQPMVSTRSLVITPFDCGLNQLRERVNKYGTCGRGIGETRHYHKEYGEEALFVGDLKSQSHTLLKLRLKQLRAIDTAKSLGFDSNNMIVASMLSDSVIRNAVAQYYAWTFNVLFSDDYALRYMMQDAETTIFEGAQGVMLDERDEFLPHNTWTKTTFENADKLLDKMYFDGERRRIGCVRSYLTRHGAGPFLEDEKLSELPELHNPSDGLQSKFRRGHFQTGTVRYALDVCGGVDEIHMSHMDYLPQIYGPVFNQEQYVNRIEGLLETPITTLGYGPTFKDRRERDAKGLIARRRVTKASAGVSCSEERQAKDREPIQPREVEVSGA